MSTLDLPEAAICLMCGQSIALQGLVSFADPFLLDLYKFKAFGTTL